ncbi:MAG TPA: autotransporter domain-containing protein [Casimicrobiaceae bacterium]|nr:autotransporter domain-containing protein [Casimicrobiaceae bacterium]
MRRIKRSALAAALLVALSVSHREAAAQFSGMFFFGDSLTDAGTFKPLLPPGTGKFTTNPGPVWAEILGQRYGFIVTPANQGGTDYAEGGARVTDLPGVPATPPTGTATPVATQVSSLLAKGPLNSGALYSLWGGGNDVLVQLSLLASGAATPGQVQTNLTAVATQLVQQVGRLNAAGARYIIVWNLPDIGKTPFGVGSGQSAGITQLTNLFNSTLSAGLDALHIDVIRLNDFLLLNEAIANPAAFGLTNVTTPACTTASSLLCTPSTLVAPNAAQTYLFADGVHPTTAGHQLLADYAASVLEAPQKIGLLAETPLQVEQATFRALDDRMMSQVGAPRAQNKFEAYAIYDFGNYDRSNDFGGGDSQSNTVVLGGDMKLSDRWLAGLAFGYTENKASLGDNGGGFKLDEPTMTAYTIYADGPWYAGASLGGGDLDFRDIHRNITLGPGSRTESGSTRGTHLMARAFGGYWFNYAGWSHGPFLRATYQEATVYAWSETGSSSTAMSFGHQKRDSFASSLGWQTVGSIGMVRPYARVTWEKDYNNDDRIVRAGLVSTGGVSFGFPALKPDSDYALFDLGAAAELGTVGVSRITGFVSVNATASKGDGNYQAITVGIRASL